MKKKKISMYPKKVVKERERKMQMFLFIGGLLLVATAIAIYMFWDSIVKFLTKSGAIIIIALALVLVSVVSGIVIARLKNHDSDKF